MIRISLTPAAFEAIAATLPLGSVGFVPQLDAKGERAIWVDPTVADKLKAQRRPGESYSKAIVRVRITSLLSRDRASPKPFVACSR